jgi:hypothetical protein
VKITLKIKRLRFNVDPVSTDNPILHLVKKTNHQIMVFIKPAGLLS